MRKGRWVKLYVREVGSFAQLPLYVRALAAELLKICDPSGCIALCGKQPWEAVAFQLGADLSDRRLLKKHIPMLIADGYLAVEDGSIVVRNFAAAQDRHEREPNATETRARHDSNATETRPRHERDTRSESSPQNPRPIHPSEKRREEKRETVPVSSEDIRQRTDAVWSSYESARGAVFKSLRLTAPRLHPTDDGRKQLAARLREAVDAGEPLADAVGRCLHVLGRAELEAKKAKSVDWLDGQMWRKDRFDRLASRPLEPAAPAIHVIDLSAHDNPFASGAIEPMFTVDPE